MSLAVGVHCGNKSFKQTFIMWLKAEGLVVGGEEAFLLLIDKPLGWIMVEALEVSFERCIILTDSLCPVYLFDLIDRQPAAVIQLANREEILHTLRAVRLGQIIYPKVTTTLTPTERRVLQLVALGYDNKRIAKTRDITEGSVKNSLVSIYKKLGLHSRVDASHYYFDNWHLLQNWQKPGNVL